VSSGRKPAQFVLEQLEPRVLLSVAPVPAQHDIPTISAPLSETVHIAQHEPQTDPSKAIIGYDPAGSIDRIFEGVDAQPLVHLERQSETAHTDTPEASQTPAPNAVQPQEIEIDTSNLQKNFVRPATNGSFAKQFQPSGGNRVSELEYVSEYTLAGGDVEVFKWAT